jgi:anti-sigma B factor antagonist
VTAILSSSDHAIDYHLSRQADGTVLFQFRGEMDLAGAAVVEAGLRQATREPPLLLVLDLCAVTFIDSAGVLLLFRAYRGQQAADKALRIVLVPGQSAHRVLTLIGLTVLPGIEWETVAGNEHPR